MRVVIESPYAGDVDANVAYARLCVLDCLRRGEAPYASHLFFPQVLDDAQPEERKLGIEAGLAWGRSAELVAVYVDRGVSDGMKQGITDAVTRSAVSGDLPRIVLRSLNVTLEFYCSFLEIDIPSRVERVLRNAHEFGKLVAREKKNP